MSLNITRDNGIQTISFPEELTIYQARSLWEELSAADFPEPRVRLDFEHTRELDGSGIQLIVSLTNTVKAKGLAVETGMASDEVKNILQLFQLIDNTPSPINRE